MMTEKTIEKNLRDRVKLLGGLAIKFFSPWFTGMPDRIVLMPGGRIYFVEVKSPGAELKPRQRIVIPFLIKLGFTVLVIDSESDLNDFFKLIAK
jgi:hypothetical protein